MITVATIQLNRMLRSAGSFLIVLAVFLPAQAFHIIGGEITYSCLGENGDGTRNYAFVMTQYRDCFSIGANFDTPASIGIYSYINGVYSFVGHIKQNHGPVQFVLPPDDPCLIVPSNVCVEKAEYHFTVSNLPVINGSYVIFWRRCCRNQTINNIVNPRDVGAMFSVEITARAQQLCNNSPRFRELPPTVICVNEPLVFDHSAFDVEGDQLVYEFCAPLIGGGPLGGFGGGGGSDTSCQGIRPSVITCPPEFIPVTYVAPAYSAINPMGGNPQMTINPVTGVITGTPNVLGQFVVGVCVKEYRNGELLSVLQRDFQFNVSTCQIAVEAAIASDTILAGRRFVVNSCGDNTVDFINLSQREANIVSYEWTFDLNGESNVSTTRNTSVTFPGIGTYTGQLILNRGLTCTDTADIAVNIYPEIISDFTFAYDTCIAAPVVFTDQSYSGSGQITNWQWSFGEGSSTQVRNPSHLYTIPGNHAVTLRVTDINRCVDERVQTIPYFPVPPLIIVEPSTFNGCEPATVFFDNLSVPIDETYDLVWSFGDGSQGFDISPEHTYTSPGTYSVSVSITSPIGCFISADFNNWIRVRPSPRAGFAFQPEIFSSFDRFVTFTDQSVDAIGWQWTFGQEGLSFIRHPSYEFRDTGVYEVMQVVFHESGCTDTAYATIDVVPEVRYFLPNAFTPNFDGKNDEYRGVGVVAGMTEFEMTIWSRWGEMVFRSHDPFDGWNGRKFNTGAELPVGVYVCVVRYRDPRNTLVELQEFATLIR